MTEAHGTVFLCIVRGFCWEEIIQIKLYNDINQFGPYKPVSAVSNALTQGVWYKQMLNAIFAFIFSFSYFWSTKKKSMPYLPSIVNLP